MPELLEVRIGSKLHIYDERSPLRCRCGWQIFLDESTTWAAHINAIVVRRTGSEGSAPVVKPARDEAWFAKWTQLEAAVRGAMLEGSWDGESWSSREVEFDDRDGELS